MQGNISQVNDTITGNISPENETLTGNVVMPIGVTPDISVGTTETLQPNESAYVELDEASTRLNPIFNFGIPKGDTGDKGDTGAAGSDGVDGYSPTATVSKTGKIATITIIDKNGTTTAEIRDGEDGQGSGDMLKATYDANDNGIVDNAEKVNNHTVESNVPSNAVFTDTTYTAGSNIQISNENVISATDTTYTAGTGIDITNGVISNTQTSAEWGNITGTLSNQTDLATALGSKADASSLSSKQDTLISGTNIKTINNNSLLGSGNISIEEKEVEISNNEPTDPDVKLWIDTGEVQSIGKEVNIGTSVDSKVGLNVIVGKNLFDGILELGSYDSSGNKGVYNAQYRNANKISVLPNTTYTTSINGTAQQYVMLYYNANGTFLSSADNRTGTFTTPANCYYVNFRCYDADYTSSFATLKVQLEKGSVATTYEPYITPSIYANNIEIYKKDNNFHISEIGSVVITGVSNAWGWGAISFKKSYSDTPYVFLQETGTRHAPIYPTVVTTTTGSSAGIYNRGNEIHSYIYMVVESTSD